GGGGECLLVPGRVLRTASLRAHVVLTQDAARRQDEREAAVGALARRHVLRREELTLATYELVNVHRRRAFGSGVIAGPLDATEAIELLVANTRERRRETRDLVHDLRRMLVVHRITERIRQQHRDLPVLVAATRRHDFADARNTTLGIRERAVLLKEGRPGQEHV